MTTEPFRIAVPQGDVDDLRQRLRRARWPDQVPGSGWTYGADLGAIRALATYYDITRWTELDRGGHFAALEEPDLLVDEMRAFFRALR